MRHSSWKLLLASAIRAYAFTLRLAHTHNAGRLMAGDPEPYSVSTPTTPPWYSTVSTRGRASIVESRRSVPFRTFPRRANPWRAVQGPRQGRT